MTMLITDFGMVYRISKRQFAKLCRDVKRTGSREPLATYGAKLVGGATNITDIDDQQARDWLEDNGFCKPLHQLCSTHGCNIRAPDPSGYCAHHKHSGRTCAIPDCEAHQ